MSAGDASSLGLDVGQNWKIPWILLAVHVVFVENGRKEQKDRIRNDVHNKYSMKNRVAK